MTIGIDLGDRKSHFCALNDQAQVIARGFLPTTITAFRREFEGLPPSLVAIEAGAHSLWANQVLKVCGHEVLVGNPRKIRLITESDRKSDRVDAESLARLARADRLLLAPIQHRTQEKQVQLSVIRARHVLVRSRTALINCARGLVNPRWGAPRLHGELLKLGKTILFPGVGECERCLFLLALFC
jgi:transposase